MREIIPYEHPVTVIVPMYNEENYILDFLRSLSKSKHPKNFVEVIIIDGLSSDDSVELIRCFSCENPELEIKIIDNTERTIPNALNLGIAAAANEIILRMDCHAEYHEDYISNSVENLLTLPDAVGVGGVITPVGKSNIGKAIALAMASKLGNGGSRYRCASVSTPSDTIWCGCWRRTDAIRVGCFDKSKKANEDFEFNQRLKKIGQIYTCPDIKAFQYVRENYADLYQQYERYGFWKVKVLIDHPNTLKLRQMIPPVFFICLLICIATSKLSVVPLLIMLFAYSISIATAPITLHTKSLYRYFCVCGALIIMHFAWFVGMLKRVLSPRTPIK